MNPLHEKKGIFFLVLACLGQVFLVLSCTLWRGVVLFPVPWKCPPLERDYLVWWMEEYVPPVPYDDLLTSLYYNLAPLLRVLLIVGLVWLFWRVYRKSRRGLAWFFGLLALSAVVFLLLVAWLQQYGQPYYLYLDVASDTWLLALDVLVLSLVPLLDARRHRAAVEMPPV